MSSQFMDLSKLELKDQLGKGAFAEVYKVIDKKSGKIFAAKIFLHSTDTTSEDEKISLVHEVNIMSKLCHPTVLQFIGYSPVNFENQNKPILFTEFAKNGSLSQLIQYERQSLSLPGWDDTKKLIIIYGIASGMNYLHEHNIIHRDLKPDNILMNEILFPKISDFGISKINHTADTMTLKSITNLKGTPRYIAPEVWENQKYDKTGDVYSFSLIVYEIVTNKIPFKDLNTIGAIYKSVVLDNKRPHIDFQVPQSYRNLIEKCWSSSPSDRPTFNQIVDILETDKGFITSTVDEDDFNDSIDYIKQYNTHFDSSTKVITMADLINSKKKTFDPVSLDESPQKEYEVGKNYFEGINEYKHDTALGIKFLKSAAKKGCIESISYYARLLIEGQFVPKNLEKAKKYLSIALKSKDPTVLTLYARVESEIGNTKDAEKYFEMASKNGNPESQFEYGKMLFYKALNYLEMAEKNGFSKSTTFLKEHIKDSYCPEKNSKANDEEKEKKADEEKEQKADDEEKEQKADDDKKEQKTDDDKKEQKTDDDKKESDEDDEEERREEEDKEKIQEEEEEEEDMITVSLKEEQYKNPSNRPYINILKNLVEEGKLSKNGRQKAVLLSTGSYCPIHKGHLKLLDTASLYLSENHQIDSILGIISPSSDLFVTKKMKSEAINFKHRYEIARLACIEHNEENKGGLSIVPDGWEGLQPKFVDFPLVKASIQKEITNQFPGEKIKVIYVCGTELFMNVKLYTAPNYLGIGRPGSIITVPKNVAVKGFICNDKKYTSSYSDATLAIQMAKERKESLEGLTYSSVAKYLHDVVHWI